LFAARAVSGQSTQLLSSAQTQSSTQSQAGAEQRAQVELPRAEFKRGPRKLEEFKRALTLVKRGLSVEEALQKGWAVEESPE